MKKLVTILSVAVLTATQAKSQVYVSAAFGNNFSFNSNDPVGFMGDVTNTTTTLKTFNLGRGMEPNVNIGYMFSKHVGVELGVGYLMGMKNVFTDKNTQQNSTNVNTMYSRILRISPAVVISGAYQKLNPYAKFGFQYGMGSIFQDYKYTTGSNVKETSFKASGATGMGMFGGLGVEYFVAKKMTIFLEAQASNLSATPKKGEYTKYVVNGTDKLSDLPTSFKQREYVKELDASVSQPNTSPKKELRSTYSLGANNLSLGIRFRF